MNRNCLILFTLLVTAGLCPVSAQQQVEVLNVGTPTGTRAFVPGRWSAVGVSAANPGQVGATVRVSVYDKGNPQLRFGRDVWVPPGAMRWTTIPIHVPHDTEVPGILELLGHVESGGRMAEGIGGTRLARVAGEPTTVLIEDSDPLAAVAAQAAENPPYELVVATRVAHGLSRTIITPGSQLLPTSVHAWDPVSHVVVAGERLTDEPGAASALRGWVADGGRLWIQVNRAELATVETLLGSAVTITAVDRVMLNRFAIHDPEATLDQPPLQQDLVQPVELMRAWVEGGRVLREVDGWPAAVEVPFGQGRVLLTLLDGFGWLRPRADGDAADDDPMYDSDYVPIGPLAGGLFARDVVQSPSVPPVPAYLPERIGYRIPSRGSVLAVLVGVCVVLLGCGLWLLSRGRLELLGWQSVLIASVAAAVLVGLGMTRRSEVPATLAQLRLVRTFPETGEQATWHEIAVFQPEQTTAEFLGRDLLIDPHMPQLGGQIRRWTWLDGHRWRWDSTRLPPGVLLMQGRSYDWLPSRIAARASFDARGLVGQLKLPGLAGAATSLSDSLTDPIVLFPDHRPMAANLEADGSFHCGQRDLLAEGQFTATTLVGQDQRRRAGLLAQWLPWLSATATVDQPVLVGWADAWPTELAAPAVDQRQEETLLVVPIRLTRTAPGQQVQIPPAAVRARTLPGKQGVSGIFENSSQSWISPNTRPTSTRLRFQLPQSVLPLRPQSVALVLDCHLPSRPLEVFVVSGTQRHSLGVWNNASGRIEARIDARQPLATDEGGGLVFDIEVGQRRGDVAELTMANSGWSIHSSHLKVAGTTSEMKED